MHAASTVRPASHPSPCLAPGFTLVELLVATVVLAVGLLALTSAGAATVKLEYRGQRLSAVAALGETRLELLRANRCAPASGGAGSAGLDERWSSDHGPTRTRVLLDSITHSGGESVSRASYTFRSAVRC